MRSTTLAALGTAVLLLATACGAGGADDTSTADCADVWVEGATLPKDYTGCTDRGQVVTPELLPCNNRGGQWTTYGDRLAGVLGDEIFAVSGGSENVMVTC